MLCDYQPHPLKFVWAFLVAGLIRTLAQMRGRARFQWLFELALADFIGFQLFGTMVGGGVLGAPSSLPTVAGVVGAWLLSLAATYPLRAFVAQRASRRCIPPRRRPLAGSTVAERLVSLAAAAVASTCVLLLSVQSSV